MHYDPTKHLIFEVIGHDYEVIGHEIRDLDDKFLEFVPYVPAPAEFYAPTGPIIGKLPVPNLIAQPDHPDTTDWYSSNCEWESSDEDWSSSECECV